jgi:ABC-type nitrate/sulfonate/bicarbonate transport system substrate-binding protein
MRFKRSVAAVATIVLAASVIAVTTAHGSPSKRAATPSTHRADGVDTINYGLAVYSGAYWGLYIAQKYGFFAKQHIALNVSVISSSPLILAAAEGGSIDMFSVANDSAALAISKGANISLVAGIQRVSGLQFVVQSSAASHDGLKGATVAATNPSSSDAVFLRLGLLKQFQLHDGDFNIVSFGTFPNRAAAVRNGQAKASMLTEPWTTQLIQQGGFKNLGNANEWVGSDYNFLNIGVSSKWAQSHRGLVVRFLRGYDSAVRWLYDPRNKTRALRALTQDPVDLSLADAKVTYNAFVAGKTKVLSDILTTKDVLTGVRVARSENNPTLSTDTTKYADLSYYNAMRKLQPLVPPKKK